MFCNCKSSTNLTVTVRNIKCIPILLYGLVPFDLSSTDLRSLDFVINRFFFMKLFKTTSMKIDQLSQTYFCFELPSILLKKELKNFTAPSKFPRIPNRTKKISSLHIPRSHPVSDQLNFSSPFIVYISFHVSFFIVFCVFSVFLCYYRVGHKKPSPYMSANYVFQE